MDYEGFIMSAGNNTKCPSEKTSRSTASPSPKPCSRDLETEESASSLHCYNLPDYRLDPEILRLMRSAENQVRRRDEKAR